MHPRESRRSNGGTAWIADWPEECLPLSADGPCIRDVMTTDVIRVTPETTLHDVAGIMAHSDVFCVVVEDRCTIVGILTETDFVKKTAEMTTRFDAIGIDRAMSSPVTTIAPDASVLEASKLMEALHIKRLIVVKYGDVVGMVSQADLVQVLSAHGLWRNIAEIMKTELVHVRPDATAAQAAELMAGAKLSCVVVMETAGNAIGIFTERDLLKKVIINKRDPGRTLITEVMSAPLISAPCDTSLLTASKLMARRNVRRLAVTRNGSVCGIVTQTDIFKAINRRVRDEENLALSRMETSHSNVFMVDSEGNTTYVNPALMKLLEVSDIEQLVGLPFLPPSFWQDPNDRPGFIDLLREGTIEDTELSLRTKKGKPLYITVFSKFTRNAQKEICGSQGILHDITEKKNAQKELSRSHSLLHAALNSTLDGLCVVDMNRQITSYNRKLTEMWHLVGSIEEGDNEARLVRIMSSQLRDPDGFVKQMENIYAHPEEESFCTLVFKDGRVFERYSQPQILEGRIVGRVWSYHDATERVLTKKKLEALARFTSESPSPILRIMPDGRIDYANEASTPILESWHTRAEQQCPDNVRQAVIEALDSRNGSYSKIKCRQRLYSLMLVPIGGEGYVNVYGRDVTELTEAENELRAVNRKLEGTVADLAMANIESQDFAHIVSHDLKSAIRAIGTLTNWLTVDLKGRLSGESEAALSLLFKRADRLNEMLDAIQEYTDIGHMPVRQEIVDLHAIVTQVIFDINPPPNVVVTISPSMPRVRCENARIAQVIHNLVANAIQYGDKEEIRIEIACHDEGDEWRLYVADNGPGIESKHKEKIFELFETLHPHDETGGLGIGLSLVKKILGHYGGRIWVESQVGRGSRFYFTLPKKHFAQVGSQRESESFRIHGAL